MQIHVGTSGYSYKEWKGSFYPKDLPADQFLRFYAEHLGTVEINNTFYRMPTPKLLEGWAAEVPEPFKFAIKAPQRITHAGKLQNAGGELETFVNTASILGSRLGPLLFQLPPFFRKDAARLDAFLSKVPKGVRAAFEFRHTSWFDDETWAILRAHGVALCVAEGESLESPLVPTAECGYVRLRRDAYPDDVLATWAQRILAQPWREAFVYLKHDDGDAPSVAARLIDKLGR
jgi:uncharacterized protein YecE (DUF72 family)